MMKFKLLSAAIAPIKMSIKMSALALLFLTGPAFGQKNSLFSQIPIRAECETAYQEGMQDYREGMEERRLGPAFFERRSQRISEVCRFAYSAGLYDAQGLFLRKTLVEYGLELAYGPKEVGRFRPVFEKRLQQASLDPAVLDRMGVSHLRERAYDLAKQLHQQATESAEAVVVGRFIFTADRSLPYTLYRYSPSGPPREGRGREELAKLRPGSYQQKAKRLIRSSAKLVEDYARWRPGLIFSRDSYWWGSLRRARKTFFGLLPNPLYDPQAKSQRRIKEERLASKLLRLRQQARDLHLKLAPFWEIAGLFNKIQLARTKAELQAFDRLETSLWAAPFVPLGMYLGAAGLAQVGLKASAATSGTLAMGSWASAANISALLSASAMAGTAAVGTYQAVRSEINNEAPFRFTRVFEGMALSTLNSFPLAAALPAAVGGVANAGKSIALSGRALLASARSGWAQATKLSAPQLGRALARLPLKLTKKWLSGWWTNKLLIINLSVDTSVAVIFDIASRELLYEGKNRFFSRDEDGHAEYFKFWKYNPNSMHSLTTGLILAVLGTPLNIVDNFMVRYFTWRMFTFLSGVSSGLILKGEVDWEKVGFDAWYGATIGTGMGETCRLVKYGKVARSIKGSKRVALLFLFGLSTRFIRTPLRQLLLDAHTGRSDKDLAELARDLYTDYLAIDLGDYSDQEIAAALREVQTLEKQELIEILQDHGLILPHRPASERP